MIGGVGAALAHSGMVHVGGNFIAEKIIKSKKFKDHLADKFMQGISNSPVSVKNELMSAFTSGVIPEMQLLSREARAKGDKLRMLIRETGKKGDYTSREFKKDFNAIITEPHIAKGMRRNKLPIEEIKDFVGNYRPKRNGINDDESQSVIDGFGTMVGLAGMVASGDYLTPLINVGKHVMSLPKNTINKIKPLSDIQDNLRKRFVANPIADAVEEALSGVKQEDFLKKNKLFSLLVNPAVGAARELNFKAHKNTFLNTLRNTDFKNLGKKERPPIRTMQLK